MKMEISVAEAMELINKIRQQPDSLFELIRGAVKEKGNGNVREILEYPVHCGRRDECHVNQESTRRGHSTM